MKAGLLFAYLCEKAFRSEPSGHQTNTLTS